MVGGRRVERGMLGLWEEVSILSESAAAVGVLTRRRDCRGRGGVRGVYRGDIKKDVPLSLLLDQRSERCHGQRWRECQRHR